MYALSSLVVNKSSLCMLQVVELLLVFRLCLILNGTGRLVGYRPIEFDSRCEVAKVGQSHIVFLP